MQASINSQSRNVSVKSSVTSPVFRADECEDVHEFVTRDDVVSQR